MASDGRIRRSLRALIAACLVVACEARLDEIPEGMETMYAADVALEGMWLKPTEPGLAYSLLRIRRIDGARFTIEHLHALDVGTGGESYGAMWSGAALIPERYLRSGGPLFPVRFDGKEALVPAVLFAQLAPSERTSKNYEEIFYWRVAQDQAEQVWHDFGGR